MALGQSSSPQQSARMDVHFFFRFSSPRRHQISLTPCFPERHSYSLPSNNRSSVAGGGWSSRISELPGWISSYSIVLSLTWPGGAAALFHSSGHVASYQDEGSSDTSWGLSWAPLSTLVCGRWLHVSGFFFPFLPYLGCKWLNALYILSFTKICVKMDSNSEQQFLCWFCSSLQAGPLKPFKSSPSWCQARIYVTVEPVQGLTTQILQPVWPAQSRTQSQQLAWPALRRGWGQDCSGAMSSSPWPAAALTLTAPFGRFRIGSQQQLGSKGDARVGAAEESGSAHCSKQPCWGSRCVRNTSLPLAPCPADWLGALALPGGRQVCILGDAGGKQIWFSDNFSY